MSLNGAERRLLCLLPPRHVLQIGSDQLDIAVAQIIGKRRHDLSRPAAYGFRVADQIVQPLRCQIFSRVLRQVEIGADIGSAGSVKLVTGEALHKEESLATRAGSVGGSAESTASAGQRKRGEGWLASFAN